MPRAMRSRNRWSRLAPIMLALSSTTLIRPAHAFLAPSTPSKAYSLLASSASSLLPSRRRQGLPSWPAPVSSSQVLFNSARVHDLGSLTVEQLKEALKRRGLKTIGKKGDLLQRLREDIHRVQQEEMGLMMGTAFTTSNGSPSPASYQTMTSSGTRSSSSSSASPLRREIEDDPASLADTGSDRRHLHQSPAPTTSKKNENDQASISNNEEEEEDMDEEEDKNMDLEDRLIASLAKEVRKQQRKEAVATNKQAAGAGQEDLGKEKKKQQQSQRQLVISQPAAGVGDRLEDRLLDSLPDYPTGQPKHTIKKRHVGWDGALKGYTLGDGSYVNVKEDPRLTDKDRMVMEENFRREIRRWETDHPEKWGELIAMCDAAEARKTAMSCISPSLGRGEKADEEEDETEKMVKEVERLEREREVAEMPMARKMEEWEEARWAQAVEVGLIDTQPKEETIPIGETVVLEEKQLKQEDGGIASKGEKKVKMDQNEEAGIEAAPKEGEEEEYVPIDAMYRDEIEVRTADGNILRGYMVSSKMAQKFWRRKERPVVLLLADDLGWRSVQTRKLADHMAFLTNHVFFVPDLFRGETWDKNPQTLKEWKQQHPPMRLLQDARSAMECLSCNYNATATGLVGFGIGGGQALSAVASGYIKASAVVAMCPTGYDASKVSSALDTPALVVLSGDDIPESPLADAVTLMDGFAGKKALPYMMRIFKDCAHGFVTRPKAGEEERAEDAVMLATSWLEIQLRGGRAKLIRDSRVC